MRHENDEYNLRKKTNKMNRSTAISRRAGERRHVVLKGYLHCLSYNEDKLQGQFQQLYTHFQPLDHHGWLSLELEDYFCVFFFFLLYILPLSLFLIPLPYPYSLTSPLHLYTTKLTWIAKRVDQLMDNIWLIEDSDLGYLRNIKKKSTTKLNI